MLHKKLYTRSGISMMQILILLLALAVIIAGALIFFIPAYQNHLTDMARTMDNQSVATAKDVCSIQYLQDGASGLKVYYYDELSHSALDRKDIEKIKGYGRTSRDENRNEESGAIGVPNMGERGGAQLLAVALSEGIPVNCRWTGHEWTYPDYYYMTVAERKTLTTKQLRTMDKSSISLGASCAKAQYEKDFEKDLKKKVDPGKAVYVYDALADVVYYVAGSQLIPEGAATVKASKMKAYDVEKSLGNVVQIEVTYDAQKDKVVTETEWVEGNHSLNG